MKRCTKCGQEKPEAEFYRHHKGISNSLRPSCKVCCIGQSVAYTSEHREKLVAKNKAKNKVWSRTEKGRKSTRTSRHKYHADSRRAHEIKAQKAVGRALKTGRMVRLPCVICGDSKSQGHHEDYDKPLEVVWLCQKHHKARHREIDAEQITAS